MSFFPTDTHDELRKGHAVIVPDETPEVKRNGLVQIDAKDGDVDLTLMLFTRHARALRDALNSMDLG